MKKSCPHLKGNKRGITHGMSRTATWMSWNSMKSRCNNKNASNFRIYGGRGIKICKRWNKFENFYKDMGERPEGKFLDRIDCNGNYKPSNCRWATAKENGRNRRRKILMKFKGKKMMACQIAEELGNITQNALLYRYSKNPNDPNLFGPPRDRFRKIRFKGKSLTIWFWAKETGIGYATLLYRINKRKWPIHKALSLKPSYKELSKR